ncbi:MULTISPECIES: DUF3289 family protein [Flavobacterium]|uniref:DUF3289 family protein n=1 Tax=Flavobacterium jumunjinense TaxID=998845 RepID=A0ABV5GRH5_9FLAO|nr:MULTISPECIES: DUF3289 family protein [Flavobacterium]
MNEGGNIVRTTLGTSHKEAETIAIRATKENLEFTSPNEVRFNGKEGGKKFGDFVAQSEEEQKTIRVNSKLIGKARRDPGYNFDKTPAEDMMSGDKPPKSASIMNDAMFTHNNATLGAYLDQLMQSLSIGSMETVALEMSSLFKSGTGGTYKSDALNKEIENNAATLKFHDNFVNLFKAELSIAKYDPNQMEIIPMDLLNFSSFWDKVSGLGITIHQVWSVKAEIENYVYTESNGKWECDLIYTFYDHFGLDWDDIVKHGSDRIPQYHTGDCFKAWYILQHYRNAKPFITEMIKKIKITN